MKYFTLLITIFAFSQIDANQKVFKWVDAQGNTHYSETKPDALKTSEVKIRSTKSTVVNTNTTKEKSTDEDQLDTDESQASEELTQEQKDVAEYNEIMRLKREAENCKIAKQNLQTLQETSNVLRKDPKTGETSYMDNKVKTRMMKETRKTIKETCK